MLYKSDNEIHYLYTNTKHNFSHFFFSSSLSLSYSNENYKKCPTGRYW